MEKRLYRSRKEKIIAGVSGGIGEYFAIDPVLVRIVFIILAFQAGAGILAYIILWIVVPYREEILPAEELGELPGEQPEIKPDAVGTTVLNSKRSGIGGAALIVLGLLLLADTFIPYFDFIDLWPLILIAIGGGLLWHALSNKRI